MPTIKRALTAEAAPLLSSKHCKAREELGPQIIELPKQYIAIEAIMDKGEVGRNTIVKKSPTLAAKLQTRPTPIVCVIPIILTLRSERNVPIRDKEMAPER